MKEGHVQEIHATNVDCRRQSKEHLWHRRFRHLGISGLRTLVRDSLVEGLDFDCSKELEICEPCIDGKQHRAQFPLRTRKARNPLDLVYSNVCVE